MCKFEYGPTTSLGSSATCSPAAPGSGSSPVLVSAAVSGLNANATYYFRVVATNVFGTSKSPRRTLKTP
jgi:hypothetical protein